MQQRKRAYHGRRGPSTIVWLIAAVVLVAAIVLVVVGLTKKPAVLPAEDPDPVVDPATPETPDNTDANTPDSTDPDGTNPAQKPDDTQQPADNQPDDKTTTTASDEPYIDANGLLQFSTKGHYVQADSYQGGGEAPWNLLLVNDWNPLPSGYDSDVSFTTVSGGKQVAMDVGGSGDYTLEQTFANTPAYTWLMEHCADYGFILRFPEGKEDITGVIYEPWHYRYVGEEAARYIMDNNLCLEEYLEQVKQ